MVEESAGLIKCWDDNEDRWFAGSRVDNLFL